MEDILEALPPGVRRAAAEMDGNIRDRLVTGEKMTSVWAQIIKRKANSDTIKVLPQKYRCLDEVGLDDNNIAIAAIFNAAIAELTEISQYDTVQNEEFIERCRNFSSMCRVMPSLRFMGGIDEHIGDLHPRHDPEMREALTKAACFFDRLAEALERSDRGVRWDHRDDIRSNIKISRSKTQWERSDWLFDPSSIRSIRARLSAFIEAADKLYDKPRLIGPLASIASAVLAKPIDHKLVENCRRSLDRHRGPQMARPS